MKAASFYGYDDGFFGSPRNENSIDLTMITVLYMKRRTGMPIFRPIWKPTNWGKNIVRI
jgi:hypothetical protein